MFLTLFYGLATLIAILLTASAGREAPLRVGCLLGVNWLFSNIAVYVFGFARAPLLMTPLDAVTAIGILMVGLRYCCRIGKSVFAIFMVGGLVHAVSYALHGEASRLSYTALNLLYLAAVALVGWTGLAGLAHRHGRESGGARRPLARI
jgi:hypothetical protein